jgi:hypothetical protein
MTAHPSCGVNAPGAHVHAGPKAVSASLLSRRDLPAPLAAAPASTSRGRGGGTCL